MNFANFFQAIGMIASQQIDPFEFSDWLVACEWRELYDAWQEVQ